jgi:hypothetical protein
MQKEKKDYFRYNPKGVIRHKDDFWQGYFYPAVADSFMVQFLEYLNHIEFSLPKFKQVSCKTCVFWTPEEGQLRGVCGNRFFNRQVNNNGQNITTNKFKCHHGKRSKVS